MLKLTGLPQFLAVCSTRSLTLAAEQMGVTQPALTQAIAKLERQLGVTLFDRTSRPLTITPYGHVLYDYAQVLEESTEALTAKLEALKAGSGGLVRVGCGPDWIHEILPIAISRLQAESPDIRVSLTVALNDDLRAMLDADKLDMFFASITDHYFGAAYETRVLLRDEMLVVAHRDHPVHRGEPKSLEELAEIPWVMTGDETFGRQLMRRVFGRAGVQLPPPLVETNSVRAMINFLRHSQTLGFLSRTHSRSYPEIAAVETLDQLPQREGGVTWRRDAPLLPAAERLVALVEKTIAKLRNG